MVQFLCGKCSAPLPGLPVGWFYRVFCDECEGAAWAVEFPWMTAAEIAGGLAGRFDRAAGAVLNNGVS